MQTLTHPASEGDAGEVHSEGAIMCSANPSLNAAAFCSSCTLPYAGSFLGAREDGRALCFACARRYEIPLRHVEVSGSSDPALRDGWRGVLHGVLAEPQRVFSTSYTGPIGPALRAGWLWCAIGDVAAMSWAYIFKFDEVMERLQAASASASIPEDLLPVVPWLALPLITTARFFVGLLAFHLGLRLGGAPYDAFQLHARVFALASVGMILNVFPLVGPYLSLMVWFFALSTFVRIHYKMGFLQSFIVLMPTMMIVWLLLGIGR